MITIPNVTPIQLNELLGNLKASGEATVAPASTTSGKIVAKHKILWHTIVVNASYSLTVAGSLQVTTDGYESEIRDGLLKSLASLQDVAQ